MKDDNQHLDFLISQYVDGCLDGANKKSVEQQMLNSPTARKLYTDHREVQDLLDDWGNRIPLVDWDTFGKKLDARLEREAVGTERGLRFHRWLKPLSAAAALFVAASIGYGWHAWQSPQRTLAPSDTGQIAVAPHKSVDIVDGIRVSRASRSSVIIDEPEAHLSTVASIDPTAVAVTPPGDAAAVESLKDALGYGLQGVIQIAQPQGPSNGTWAVAPPARKNEDDKVPDVAFP